MVAVLKKLGVDGIPDVYSGGGSLIHPSIVLTGSFSLLHRFRLVPNFFRSNSRTHCFGKRSDHFEDSGW